MTEIIKGAGEQPDAKAAALVREVAELVEHMTDDELDELERGLHLGKSLREGRQEVYYRWEVEETALARAVMVHEIVVRDEQEAARKLLAGEIEVPGAPELLETVEREGFRVVRRLP